LWLDGSYVAYSATNALVNCRPDRNTYSNAGCYSCTDATSHTEYVQALRRREMF
jgi:hypothetical protein